MKKQMMFAMGFLLVLLTATAWAAGPEAMKAKMGTLKGTLYVKDKPLANALISFFDKHIGPPPIMGSGARRVPEVLGRTNAKGEFSVKLLPGSFYMGALIRDANKGSGPPRVGEEFFFIESAQGQLREFTIIEKELTEVGRVEGKILGAGKDFKQIMTINGKVTGEDGKPLAGILVTLKETMDAPRPKFISEGTAADGTFSMKVPPGKYFVVGRESVQGGKPAVGSYIGSYGKTNPATGESAAPPHSGSQPGASPAAMGLQNTGGGQALAVEGKAGEVIKDVNIQMFKIPDPVETRTKFEAEAAMGSGGQGASGAPAAEQAAPAAVEHH
jgi:hypothetical protein